MKKSEIILRQLTLQDLDPRILPCPRWISVQENIGKWIKYFDEQEKNVRSCILIEKENKIIGYGSLYFATKYPYFKENNIPEISDIWIVDPERNKGYATALIAHLETLAKNQGIKIVGIGVGLYKDYGPAQNLYAKLGYLPDGNGITYKYLGVNAGSSYPIDDDLILWLIKKL